MQEEIFGPVLVSLTFRTPQEAIELANNTRYGLAASVWSDNINLALDVASKIKAGSVWVNCTNLFDGASGFGGYRESGFGREGGREGLFEYLRPKWMPRPRPEFTPPAEGEAPKWGEHVPARPSMPSTERANGRRLPRVDRTPKMYIGGKQVRPDGNYTLAVLDPEGQIIGQVGDGNRKDIRDAVEAAHAAHLAKPGWAMRHGYNRSQILYFIAENLDARNAEFVKRLQEMTGAPHRAAQAEVDAAVERLFSYAAWADKYGGTVQETTLRGITVAINEPVGVIGIACPDEAPLLGFVSLMAPAIARGNTVVMIPSMQSSAERHGFLSGAGHVGRSGRRGQHRHRRSRASDQDADPARGCGCGLVLWLGRGQLSHGVRVGCEHEAHLGGLRAAAGLDGSRAGRGPRLPAGSHAGEEYLGADGGVR